MVVIKREEDAALIEKLNTLSQEYAEIKASASEMRKHGFDTDNLDTYLLDFEPKLRLAKATGEQYDIERLKCVLADLRREMNLAKNGSSFTHVVEMVSDTYEHLRQGRKKEASLLYEKLTGMLSQLDEQEKRLVERAVNELSLRLSKQPPIGRGEVGGKQALRKQEL